MKLPESVGRGTVSMQVLKTIFAIAALAVVAAPAFAGKLDVRIDVDRAMNGQTLTIKYTGAAVALVELRLNGSSLGTRAVDSSKSSGETNYTLNLAELKDGENSLEVRLYDRTGRLIGTEKSTLLSEQTAGSPVFLEKPRLGQTVMGTVDIQMGFNAELRNSYVSFFVNGNFKSMVNNAPYIWSWDTTREANGWHEIEAWAVDDRSNTWKSRKIRVFVNNPGGRTDRNGVITNLTVIPNGVRPGQVVGAGAGLRSVKTPGAVSAGAVTNLMIPAITAPKSGTKPVAPTSAVPSGPRIMVPTGNRILPVPAPTKVAPVKAAPTTVTLPVTTPKPVTAPKPIVIPVTKAAPTQVPKTGSVGAAVGAMKTAMTLAIQRGTRLPNIGTFSVLVNNRVVNFDVAPRVEDGVPMTPFRHLFEATGGEVKWENMTKSVTASGNGQNIQILIGDPNARVNDLSVRMEVTPYLERGRTIVPLSFLREALNVNVEFDPKTNHVLITPIKK